MAEDKKPLNPKPITGSGSDSSKDDKEKDLNPSAKQPTKEAQADKPVPATSEQVEKFAATIALLEKQVDQLSRISAVDTAKLRLESVKAVMQHGSMKDKESAIAFGHEIFLYVLSGNPGERSMVNRGKSSNPPVPKGVDPNTW